MRAAPMSSQKGVLAYPKDMTRRENAQPRHRGPCRRRKTSLTERLLSARLTPAIVPMGTASGLGTRAAAFVPYGEGDAAFTARLADLLADDEFLAAYVRDEASVSYRQLRDGLAAESRRGRVHPVFFGSAVTGAGVAALTAGLSELLPAAEGDPAGPLSAAVFKVERGPAGEEIAFARMFSGQIHVRDRLSPGPGPGRGHGPGHGPGHGQKVTAISVFRDGSAVPSGSVAAGQIGKLWGLSGVRIGDTLGAPCSTPGRHQFAPPTLETVVVPRRRADRGALHLALTQLAEQDPLINLRLDEVHHDILVSLYGEVQKEVIQATLASDFGIDAGFRGTTTLCIERPAGTGAAVEIGKTPPNPFLATVGLRIEPARPGSGVQFRLEVPADTATAVLPVLAQLRAVPRTSDTRAALCRLEGEIPAARVPGLEQQLPGLTRGEGVLDCAFARYQEVRGVIPERPRTDHNPLNRKEYLLRVTRNAAGRAATAAGPVSGRR